MVNVGTKLKDACSLEERNLDSILKTRHYYFADKSLQSQNYSFSSSHTWMWELDHKEGWTLKNWCFWAVLLEKTLESLLVCKEIKPAHPKGDQSRIFIRRTYVKVEAPCFGHLMWRTDSLENPLMLRKFEDRRGLQRMGWLMASLIQKTWVWANFGGWWRTGKPGVLQSMGSQRIRRDWTTEQLAVDED